MTSLQEVYVSVKGLIATNLSTMGVTGYSSDDGLTTLANAILEVEGGSDLTISLDLVSSSSSIYSGQTVNLTATLSATFDGETVDLNSVLQNAPITFKEGNTTINTVSTNANGVATISNYAPVGTGTVTLSAQFPTTDGFNGATDVITITVEDVSPVATTLTLTADKSILSYADSESATLSATLLDQFDAPMENETVEFFNGSTSMGTATTNSSGVATKSYSSSGAGDVRFSAEVGSLVSEIFVVKDWWRYDNCSSDKTSNYTCGTNASLSFSTDHYVMTTTTDDVVEVLDGYDKVQFEVLLEHNSNVGGIQIRQNPSNAQDGTVGLYNNASNTTYLALFPWSNVKSTNNVTNNSDYYRYILTIDGSSVTAKIENSSGTSLFSGSTSKSLSAKYFCIFNVGSNTLNIKEIVVKPL